MTINSLICELGCIGDIRIFGSTVQENGRHANDIDIGIIVSDGQGLGASLQIENILRQFGISEFARLEELLSYTKYLEPKHPKKFIHILVCEKKGLTSGHPIINALMQGVSISQREAA